MRILGHVASALIGAVMGAAIVLAASDLATDQIQTPVTDRPLGAPVAPATGEPSPRTTSTLLLAWASGGLPDGTVAALERLPGVRDTALVQSGVDWLRRSYSPDGAVVDDERNGFAIPIETAVVDPKDYASFVPPAERDALLGLKDGQALLSESEAELRNARIGSEIVLNDRKLVVSEIVSDTAAQGYEILVAGEPPSSWERVDRVVLLHIRRERTRARVTQTVESLLGPGQRLRVRARGETPYLRYGDAVLPQSIIKRSFGEFAAIPHADGTLSIDPRWASRSIRHARVPILGSVTCHRALIPQLRDALREVRDDGLAGTINPSQYGGCFGPRFIDRDPRGRLSHHAWGIGIDINVAENAFGTRPDQDRRLVEIMEQHGFTWGGRWLVPDGMHFEWTRFP